MPDAPIRYPLYVAHRAGFALTLSDEGVEVTDDAIWYFVDGKWGYRKFTDMRAINLQAGGGFGGPVFAACSITFRDGRKANIVSTNEWGTADGSRAAAYTDFIEALHAALIAEGAARQIAFTSGIGSKRSVVLTIALVLAVALFVLTPLVLWAITRDTQAFWLTLAGGLFIWPAIRMARRNQPATYRPEAPPNLLG
jgi:hypothetical protein